MGIGSTMDVGRCTIIRLAASCSIAASRDVEPRQDIHVDSGENDVRHASYDFEVHGGSRAEVNMSHHVNFTFSLFV